LLQTAWHSSGRAARLISDVDATQDSHIFDASLRDSLGLARPAATDEELDAAAARAGLLADPAPLILDEPTAHLDPDSRRALTRDLLRATAGRATLLITHDLDGLDQVDEIVVLRHGKVVRRGSYGELSHAADMSGVPGIPARRDIVLPG
jgi:ATP-binding cassette, subfamily C, bacterial CydC